MNKRGGKREVAGRKLASRNQNAKGDAMLTVKIWDCGCGCELAIDSEGNISVVNSGGNDVQRALGDCEELVVEVMTMFQLDICHRLETHRDEDPSSPTAGQYYAEVYDSSETRRIHTTACFANAHDAAEAGRDWDCRNRDKDAVWLDSEGVVSA